MDGSECSIIHLISSVGSRLQREGSRDILYFRLQFLYGAQLARIVNPLTGPERHLDLGNFRGRLKIFLFVNRIHTLFLGPALQQVLSILLVTQLLNFNKSLKSESIVLHSPSNATCRLTTRKSLVVFHFFLKFLDFLIHHTCIVEENQPEPRQRRQPERTPRCFATRNTSHNSRGLPKSTRASLRQLG